MATNYRRSFRPEQSDESFFNFAPAKLSVCAVEESRVQLSSGGLGRVTMCSNAYGRLRIHT